MKLGSFKRHLNTEARRMLILKSLTICVLVSHPQASQCRQIECLDILLSHGADPNIMDCSENTALHYAVYNGDIKTATKLLEYKANIEAVNEVCTAQA